jgi:uncharacterized repeat protein (TIGR01451 family)
MSYIYSMKQLTFIFLLIVCIQTTKAQFVTIPDANLLTWLQANVPSAITGNQMDTTSLAVTTRTSVVVQTLGISDLNGIQYFDSLKQLACLSNQLTLLPRLPNRLKYLNCTNNGLTNLPNLPNTLEEIVCSYNNITSLPNLPNSLYRLFCDHNQLSNLPNLPNNLIDLECEYNQLTSLPALPINLGKFICMHNQLTYLPYLPNNIMQLNCEFNQITNIQNLPTSLWSFTCQNNQISCFPVFPVSLMYYTLANNPFTCLPNYIPSMDAATLNYPLCVSSNTLTNPNGCPDADGIVGFTYKDNNSNCLKDAGDLGIKNVPVQLYDNAGSFLSQTYAALNGVYQFSQNSNIYTVSVDTLGLPFASSCLYPDLDSTVTVAILDTNINFALTCKPGFDAGVQSIVTNGIVFPGQNHVLNVNAGDMSHWYNFNCALGVSGSVSFSVNGPVSYVGPAAGALTPNVTGNIYTYTIFDFGTINNLTDFNLLFQVDTTAQADDAICVSATVTPINGDNNQNNNIYNHCYNVVNSYDPNIKEVYPTEVQTGFNDWLTYTIHFQNTGNAPAFNIRLEDNLDTKLDPETFQVINYSHFNLIDVTSNHLTVRFPNIQLADSTSNPEGSKGFVQYRIKPKANWVTDTIKNSAEIYFDYNAPIVTNTAKSYFMTVMGIKDINNLTEAVGISPNPTNGTVSITSRYDFEKIELLSITGQILSSETVNSKSHQLNLTNFSEGIYFVRLIYPNGLSNVKKVVKQ